MDADLFRVFILVAVLIGLIQAGLIASRVNQLKRELKEITAALNQLKSDFRGIGTIVRSQKEAIKAAGEREDSSAETALLEED